MGSEILQEWKSLIDDYQLSTPGEKTGFDMLNDKGKAILFENTSTVRNTQARERFLEYLSKKLDDSSKNPSTINTSTVNMFTLLGKEGIELYKNAIKEEESSQAFRVAVLNAATKKYDGPKWAKRLVLWVAGPSASGKTAASERIVTMMGRELMPVALNGENQNNYVVSIDGGIERELSQMRQMVLQVALSKGYKGIRDLHSNTHLKVKRKIEKAVLEGSDLSLVIPETFSGSLHRQLKANKMKRIEAMNNVIQVFSEIRSENSARFQRTIKFMGTFRAWYMKKEKYNPENIKMNNRNVGCESKIYEPQNFKWGRFASRIARHTFLKISKNKYYFKISHDLMYMTKDQNGQWHECKNSDIKTDQNKVIISEKNFQIWKKMKESGSIPPELNEIKNYPEFRENMDLNEWAVFCYRYKINSFNITRVAQYKPNSVLNKFRGFLNRESSDIEKNIKISESVPVLHTEKDLIHRVPLVSMSYSNLQPRADKDKNDSVFNQSQSNIKELSRYIAENKEEHSVESIIEYKNPQGVISSLEISFHNDLMKTKPKVIAENTPAETDVHFSTQAGLENEDFRFVVEQTAKIAVSMAKPGTVFDLSVVEDQNKKEIIQQALQKAINELMVVSPERFTEQNKPVVKFSNTVPDASVLRHKF